LGHSIILLGFLVSIWCNYKQFDFALFLIIQ